MVDIEFFKNLREKAYIDALKVRSTDDNLVGVFGPIDEAILRAYELLPMPIEGIDGFIYAYGKYDSSYCDVINSTILYLKTEKCPLLFSSKFFIFHESCPYFYEAIKANSKKEILLQDKHMEEELKKRGYRWNPDSYREVKQKLETIEGLYDKIRRKNMDARLLAYLKFYSSYELNLEKRLTFFEECYEQVKDWDEVQRRNICINCPRGILDGLENDKVNIKYGDKTFYAPKGCKYRSEKYINYEVEHGQS